MSKTILVTGATDGIGFETAKLLTAGGHTVLVHGRSEAKLERAVQALSASGGTQVESYRADLSDMAEAARLADAVAARAGGLDVLINNAGVLKAPDPRTRDGLDIRFAVNTLAPFVLTRTLMPVLGARGRIVNVSSAAQSPVNLRALAGHGRLGDMEAYSQSKLAIIMWSRWMAQQSPEGPAVIPVNPGSLLASKMVKEGFGIAGNDLSIGALILVRAGLTEEFAGASGKYWDNDAGRFGTPHAHGLDAGRCAEVVRVIDEVLAGLPD